MSQTKYPQLTDEGIHEARKVLGVELRNHPRMTEAGKGAILMFARAIGSRNPLFQDETYADRTFWGGLVAHPTFLYAVDDTIVAPKLAGIHSIYAGTDWEFYRWVRNGDSLHTTRKLVDLAEKEGRFCGRMVLQTGEIVFANQYGYTVARAISYVMRTPRDAAVSRGLYKDIAEYAYTEEELARIEQLYRAESVFGGFRYWEDVSEGEELVPVVKGPFTAEDQLHFVRTCISMPMMDYWVEHLRRHPADAYWHPNWNMPDTWMASLLDGAVAQEFGFPPVPHDTGLQRICWLDNLVTNWMGDMAFLKRLSVRLTRPNLFFDTTLCKGRVLRKERQNGQFVADIDVWCENQRGEVTAKGLATVALPSRDPDSLPPLVDIGS